VDSVTEGRRSVKEPRGEARAKKGPGKLLDVSGVLLGRAGPRNREESVANVPVSVRAMGGTKMGG